MRGRDEKLYEMEIAFENLKIKKFHLDGGNFLEIYWTLRSHRTEFCIDKLYSPDSSTGRLGILELRALICPHKHMNLVQNLLVRALVAKFWKEPYEKNLFAGNRAT
jgi:uncharacterized protein (DUF2126 family)